MTISTATITLNAAFLQEIKEDNTELRPLLVDIREALVGSASFRGRWKHFVELLGELRDHLAMYFVLEEAYGYFENPVSVVPGVSRKAAILQAQHQTLYSQICAITEQAEQWLYQETQAPAPRKIFRRFIVFSEHLQEHETREHALILQVLKEALRSPRTVFRELEDPADSVPAGKTCLIAANRR
ncbi:MAG: hypothetical protein ISR77_12275 [Pirellulaceae bacterium]|nr:hypothetical protein [Pirellulaceae bacterium]